MFSTDAQLQDSVGRLEERDRLSGIHVQAIAKYTGRGEVTKIENDEAFYFLVKIVHRKITE